jgi:seryl-tRNA synthetase
MLQINFIRNNAEAVKAGLEKKHFKAIEIVDTIINIDSQRRDVQKQKDDLAAQINIYSKQVGAAIKEGKPEEANHIKTLVSQTKESMTALDAALTAKEAEQKELLLQLPNLPHSSVPLGKHAQDNEVVKQAGQIPELHATAKPHWELVAEKNIIDFELGNKLTGAGFPVYKGNGAKLQRALINYFINYNTAAGYTEHQVPYVANTDSMYGTGQLPDKEGQMYHVTADDLYLIPTAEVPLTNMYRDTILQLNELPIKVTGYTPCFRREAGSYGKDVRGLNRLHQFDKVEIVQITTPENSYATLEQMVAHIEQLLINLELPYRILKLCSGDMSFASALTYDFEVYSTAQQRWLEVSSVSNFETFQTNRSMCRYKDENGKTQLAHSLNGSSLALPRIVAALLENNQQANGSIHIPKVLQAFMGVDNI